MGWNNSNASCFKQSSKDIFSTFASNIKIGELKALNLAQSLATKFGNNALQLEYQKLIEKKLGVNSMSMSLPSEELVPFLKSLQKGNSFERSGIMLQGAFEKNLNSSKSASASHIFTIKIDSSTKDLIHQNSDQTINRYNIPDFERWSTMFDKFIIKMLSDRHSLTR